MGRSIYFSDSEIDALRTTSGEWCEMMESGEYTVNDVEMRLVDGLGSALKNCIRALLAREFIKIIIPR